MGDHDEENEQSSEREQPAPAADAYAPPGRPGGLRGNPIMLGVVIVTVVVVAVFVILLALR